MTTILIVDDEPFNRELFHACLEFTGHTLIDAGSGEEALTLVNAAPPDLVLLDVMLPGMDGYEVCERLKAIARDEFLPIILVTALHDRAARLRGLRSGADEFLTKPVDRSELSLRVSHLLELRRQKTALVRRNTELVELHRFREEMSQLIVHDLKNPLSVMLSNIDYLLSNRGDEESEAVEALEDSRAAGNRLLRLLANLLDLAKLESGKLELKRSRVEVSSIVDPLVHQRTLLARARGIEIKSAIPAGVNAEVDAELVGRAVENVFDNALRYTPTGGLIAVETTRSDRAIQLRIGNTGHPIPPEHRTRIFEKFGRAGGEVGRMNLGLGLYFCRLAAEAHGGRLWVEETRELPTVFALELPV